MPTDNQEPNSSWLKILDQEPPRFHCPVLGQELMASCELRGCALWCSNTKSYNCAGAFGAIKSAASSERLVSSGGKEKKGNLVNSANGKLSAQDLAFAYGLPRQRLEAAIVLGRQVMDTLAPMFVSVGSESQTPTKRVGSPLSFTTAVPTAHRDPTGARRVCVCCEARIEPDDTEVVLAILDRQEVAWCSRECAREFPIDAWLLSSKYGRHWSDMVLSEDAKRLRIREVTPERVVSLKNLAKTQGYV
jgi:hypothetical protein